ncbi:SPFH domain-containing protein, partial [Nanoarchaeota archaeon]
MVFDYSYIPYVVAVVLLVLSSLKIYFQYQRGVLFTLGKFSKILHPGLRVVIPVIQVVRKIDMRLHVVDVPQQNVISKDNVSMNVNAVLYFKVFNSELAVLKVEDYYYAISQLAQTTMRNVLGEVTLDELLGKRDKLSD